MHRRYESMSARNGEIEELIPGRGRRHRRTGAGRLQLGLLRRTRPVRRRRPRRRHPRRARSPPPAPACPVRPSTWSRPAGRAGPGPAPARSTRSRSRCPTRATCWCTRPSCRHEHGADLAEGLYQIWDTSKWFVSSEGHRIDQHIRECGAGISATAIGDGETQRRSYPSYRGQYGTRGWELVDALDLGAHAAADRRGGPRAAHRAAVPGRRDHPDPRRRAAARCRSTSRSGTPSSWTGSSAGRPPSPAPPGSTWTSWAACGTAPS